MGTEVVHRLKTWPEFFRAVKDGDKRFDIRKNDRNFQPGDVLLLQEFDASSGTYSGAALALRVTYVTDFAQQPGFVVMSLERL